MPDTTPTPPEPSPAEVLAAKIARIEALRAENAADYRPSFVALLERAAAERVREVERRYYADLTAEIAAKVCPVLRPRFSERRDLPHGRLPDGRRFLT